jgi:hypothetical protein
VTWFVRPSLVASDGAVSRSTTTGSGSEESPCGNGEPSPNQNGSEGSGVSKMPDTRSVSLRFVGPRSSTSSPAWSREVYARPEGRAISPTPGRGAASEREMFFAPISEQQRNGHLARADPDRHLALGDDPGDREHGRRTADPRVRLEPTERRVTVQIHADVLGRYARGRDRRRQDELAGGIRGDRPRRHDASPNRRVTRHPAQGGVGPRVVGTGSAASPSWKEKSVLAGLAGRASGAGLGPVAPYPAVRLADPSVAGRATAGGPNLTRS